MDTFTTSSQRSHRTYVCEKHFQHEDIFRTYSIPSGPNGSLEVIPRKVLVLRKGAIICLLPGCPKYI